jgi:hypothetical protein
MNKNISDLRLDLAKKYREFHNNPINELPTVDFTDVRKKNLQTIHTLSSIDKRITDEQNELNRVEQQRRNTVVQSERTATEQQVVEDLKKRIIRGSFLETENDQLKQENKKLTLQLQKLIESGLAVKQQGELIGYLKEINANIGSLKEIKANIGSLEEIKANIGSLKEINANIGSINPTVVENKMEDVVLELKAMKNLISSHNLTIALMRVDLTKIRQEISTASCKPNM